MITTLKNNTMELMKSGWPVAVAMITLSFWVGGLAAQTTRTMELIIPLQEEMSKLNDKMDRHAAAEGHHVITERVTNLRDELRLFYGEVKSFRQEIRSFRGVVEKNKL